ncbi:hypothetical protein EMCRGX_G032945 [Ephydatia muelleri]
MSTQGGCPIFLQHVCHLSAEADSTAPLEPIIASGFLTHCQIDLIDMRHMPDDSNNYIAHYMDHWSKFHIMWPLMRKSAVEVAVGLTTKVFSYLGLPKILQSDNGREFVNEIIKETLTLWPGQVVIINGRPRYSQSQGLVEKEQHHLQNFLKEPCVMEEEVADLMDAHTPSVSPVQQASHSPSITSHVKPSRFTRSSVSSVQQASSITSPVKPSSFTRSSVSPVRQVSHSPSVTSPVKPSTFTCSQYLQFGPHLTVLQPQIHL